jgi:hypothetical protein
MYNGLIVGLQYIQEIWVVGWVEHIEGDIPLLYVPPTYTS